jgi:uncharacterized protein YjbI with pentapeptide repeats
MSEYTREEILKMIEEVGGPENLNLSGADLSGIDLSKEAIAPELQKVKALDAYRVPAWCSEESGGINLQKVSLFKANLQKANLEGANLQEAILEEANLQEANLTGANLQEATLEDADLQRAYLWEANLQQAYVGFVDLQEASLDGANLQKAYVEAANLREASLGSANLQKAYLEWADLQGAFLRWANLQEAYLEGANLQEAYLEGANLQQAYLEGANLQEAYLEGANLQQANLERANLRGAVLWGAHLEKVDLSVAESLAGAYFYQAWLDQSRVTKEQLGGRIGEEIDNEYYEAKEAYVLLKNNFNQIGRYDDASWAYRKERRMERMTHRPDLAPKSYDYPKLPDPLPTGAKRVLHRLWLPFRKARFHLSHLRNYLFDTAQLLLCDFGENPWLVLIWAAVALFVFGLAYIGFGGLGPAPGASSAIALGDRFVYSLFAFATMDHPRIVATTGLAQFLTGFEALVGIFMAAIFVFTLGNRISRS